MPGRPAWLLAVCMAAVLSTAGHAPCAAPDEIHHYREVTGNTVEDMTWHLHNADGHTLTVTSAAETHVTITDRNYDTRCWRVTASDGQTDLSAERTGNGTNMISIRGRFKGKPIEKRIEIDDCPWYQATSLSLRGLVAGHDAKRLFWTIRPETLTLHKLKAIKKKVVPLGNDVRLQHIRLTLPGLLAPFWKSDYWFDLPDGVFCRFQGPSGPPGSPMITITRMIDAPSGHRLSEHRRNGMISESLGNDRR